MNKMRNAIRISAVLLPLGLMGCAAQVDIDALKADVEKLKSQMASGMVDSEARATAQQALATANAAMSAANECQATCESLRNRSEEGFRQQMRK